MREIYFAEPTGLPELYAFLKEYGENAYLMAGGTDLLVKIKKSNGVPPVIINLKKICELSRSCHFSSRGMFIGALATLADISRHPAVIQSYRALSDAAGSVGSVQIRNRATLAGNICNGSPAADCSPALLVYNAEARITSVTGERSVSLASFFRGPNETALDTGEVVTGIFLPPPPSGSGSVYIRLSRRMGIDLAIVGVAALTSSSGEVRLACGAVGPVPFRAEAAERLLSGNLAGGKTIQQALAAVRKSSNPIDDVRASSEYRLAMLSLLTKRALKIALERCRNGGMPN